MRRRGKKLEVSTFPFLAVLLCVMGSLIFVLLVMDRRGKLAARFKNEAAALKVAEEAKRVAAERKAAREKAREAERDRLTHDAEAAYQKAKGDLHERLSAQEKEIQARLDSLNQDAIHAAAQTDAEKARQAELQRQLALSKEQLKAEEDALVKAQFAEKGETNKSEAAKKQLAQWNAELERLERTLTELRESRLLDKKTYSVVPYRGKLGDDRRPLYLECTGRGIVFHPDKLAFSVEIESERIREEVAKRVVRQREQYAKAGEKADRPPYLLLLVRPDGIMNFIGVQRSLQKLNVDFGYEFIDPDWVLDFPADDSTPIAQPWMNDRKGTAGEVVATPERRGPGNGGGGATKVDGSQQLVRGGGAGDGRGAPGTGGLWMPGGGNAGSGNGTGPGGGSPGSGGGNGSGGSGTGPWGGPMSAFPTIGGGNGGTGAGGTPSIFPIGGGTGSGAGNPGAIPKVGGGNGPGGVGTGSGNSNTPGANSPPGNGTPGVGNGNGPGGSTGASQGNGGQPNQGVATQLPDGTSSLTMPRLPGMTSNGSASANGSGNGTGGTSAGGAGTGSPQGGTNQPGSGEAGSVPPQGGANQVGGTAGAAGSPQGGTNQPGSAAAGAGSPQGGTGAPASAGGPAAGPGSSLGGSSGPGSADAAPGDGTKPRDLASRLAPQTIADPKSQPRRTAPLKPLKLNGDRDWVIFVECRADKVVLYPARTEIAIKDLEGNATGNALLVGIQQMIKRRQATLRPEDVPYRPQVRFLVRPDSLRAFHAAYPALEALPVPKSRQTLQPEDDAAEIASGS